LRGRRIGEWAENGGGEAQVADNGSIVEDCPPYAEWFCFAREATLPPLWDDKPSLVVEIELPDVFPEENSFANLSF
jgi:hypothetical protein